MAWQGLWAKAVPTVVTGAVGAAAYEALRWVVVKLPLREATVTVTAWGLRAAREAERKAAKSAEQARLTVADVMAEARDRIGEPVSPLVVADSGHDHDHGTRHRRVASGAAGEGAGAQRRSKSQIQALNRTAPVLPRCRACPSDAPTPMCVTA
ncbi:hypothetical protein LAUMK13_03436 [Mycobacterium innocens]|uniref:DUF1490 domain-containing protein n=1 Tax=Mycobacterium innocens TaxID=2341083 RepID=A0A498Q8Y4_9MYCO|nr:hypothetical protein LAUMK13_03436 [Mycobacterium innocens]